MIVEWVCKTRFTGSKHLDKIDVDDNATDEEISLLVMNKAIHCIDISWYIKDGEQE